jgi:hypothetical protein
MSLLLDWVVPIVAMTGITVTSIFSACSLVVLVRRGRDAYREFVEKHESGMFKVMVVTGTACVIWGAHTGARAFVVVMTIMLLMLILTEALVQYLRWLTRRMSP